LCAASFRVRQRFDRWLLDCHWFGMVWSFVWVWPDIPVVCVEFSSFPRGLGSLGERHYHVPRGLAIAIFTFLGTTCSPPPFKWLCVFFPCYSHVVCTALANGFDIPPTYFPGLLFCKTLAAGRCLFLSASFPHGIPRWGPLFSETFFPRVQYCFDGSLLVILSWGFVLWPPPVVFSWSPECNPPVACPLFFITFLQQNALVRACRTLFFCNLGGWSLVWGGFPFFFEED